MRFRQIRCLSTMAALCTGASILFSGAGCDRKAASQQRLQGPVPVTTQPVRIQPMRKTIDIVGTLWGDEDTIVAAKVPGRIVAVYKEAGQRVRSGEKLAMISRVDYELARKQKELLANEPLAKLGLDKLPDAKFDVSTVATVKRAELVKDNAHRNYMRLEKLKISGSSSVTDQEYDNAKNVWQVAQAAYDVEKLTAAALLAQARTAAAEVEVARQRLDDTLICAPLPDEPQSPDAPNNVRNYAVARRIASVGNFLQEGSPVYRLVDDDPLKLHAKVVEKHVRLVQEGQPVTIESEGHDRTFTGHIRFVNAQVDPANRTFEIEAIIPNPVVSPPESDALRRELKPGAFVKGRILVGIEPRAVFVPLEAVVTFAGVSKVFTAENGKAVEHRVEMGEADDDWVQVIGFQGERPLWGARYFSVFCPSLNLAEPRAIIVKGVSKLANNVPVSLMKEQPATQPATRPAE